MNLLYFGSSRRQLFGAYHAPAAAERGAVVICAPWGPEYIAAHHVLHRLATRLSESGYHALRFDYYGTGDSGGTREEGTLDSWCEDAAVAADELRDISGVSSVTTIGVRLGAVVAWRLARLRDDVPAVMMWDPVVNGAAYMEELLSAQAEIDRWSVSPVRPRRPSDEPVDVLGFPLTQQMRSSIETVKLEEFAQPVRAQVYLYYSSELPEQVSLQESLTGGGTEFHTETMPGRSPWYDDEPLGAAGIPSTMLDRMVEQLPRLS